MKNSITSKVLGVLPARKGSKGLPGKNLKPLLGRPLIAWAATELSKSIEVEEKICSTDDTEIAKVAKACGLSVPWLRPKQLAEDDTLVVEVLKHALNKEIEEKRNSILAYRAYSGDKSYSYIRRHR